MNYGEFGRFLSRQGWVKKGGTNHDKWFSPDGKRMVPIGRHKTQEIGKPMLYKLLKECGLVDAYRAYGLK